MSIASVVLAGFGNGTVAGTIPGVVTRGYSIGGDLPPEPITGGGYRRRRVYTRLPEEERIEPRERRGPVVRPAPRPLENNAEEIIARATATLDSIPPPVLAGIEGDNDQRRRDEEALLLIIMQAE